MAGDIKNKYGPSNQAITVTIPGLNNAGVRGSTAVDNSANVFVDALVMVKVKTGASGTAATGFVDVYAYGTADSGTTYSGGFGGADAAYLAPLSAVVKLGRIAAGANATVYAGGPWSVAAAFGGSLPDHWGIAVDNETGASLDASVGNAFYQGVYGQYT
jgi:hypothetical protein